MVIILRCKYKMVRYAIQFSRDKHQLMVFEK